MEQNFEMPQNNMRERVDKLRETDGSEKDSVEDLAHKEKEFREKLKRRKMPEENIPEMADEISDIELERMEKEKKLEKTEEELEKTKKEGLVDALTGLSNRGALEKMAERLDKMKTREKQKFSVLMFDIDHFKRVNDTYGHEAGDEILRRVSEIIKKTARETDFTYRYGGEEFVAILPETNTEGAVILAEKIRKKIEEEEIELNKGEKIKVTMSFGVFGYDTISDKDDMEFKDRREAADEALYKSKKTGRNKVTVYKEEKEEEIKKEAA